jgi:hypothetical protein
MEKRHFSTNDVMMKCQLSESTQLRLNKSNIKSCENEIKAEISRLNLRPKSERSIGLEKEMIDFKDTIGFLQQINHHFRIQIQYFKGFDIDLYDSEMNNKEQCLPEKIILVDYYENLFEF